MEKNEAFSYTYSAEQRQEIEEIRKKYLPPEQDKMAQLRKLHASVGSKAMTLSQNSSISCWRVKVFFG